jgi:hypothetical protein
MKKSTIIVLALFISVSAFAQIDTSVQIDRTQNSSKCNCEILQFGDKVKRFRLENNFDKITMVSFISATASLVENRRVLFNLIEYDRIENNEFVPFLSTQTAVLKYIENYSSAKSN